MNYANLLKSNGGFSLDKDNNAPTSGYMVSLEGLEFIVDKFSDLSEDFVNKVCERYRPQAQLRSEYVYFGAWVDDNKLYLDLSMNIQDREVAIAYGHANHQKAIYDVNNGESIYLD
jgi:hypothetical protein